MKAFIKLGIVLLLCAPLMTGCWDLVEPNQRSLWVGSAMDATPDGRIQFSGQIVAPKPGTSQSTNIVKSAIGSNISDAVQDIQEQLSRKVFFGHRVAMFIGERLAKRGLKEFFDEMGRNPDSNVRTQLYLVKGEDGKRFLEQPAILEGSSTKIATQAVRFSKLKPSTVVLREVQEVALSDGTRPFLPVIEILPISGEGTNQGSSGTPQLNFRIGDIALFNRDVQLVGYLQGDEADAAMWAAGTLKRDTLTNFIPKGNGYVTLDLARVRRHVHSVISRRQVTVYVKLTGTGLIRENNSSLDLFNQQTIRYVEREFDRNTEELTKRVIAKVQKDYGTDIFGFGEDVHRRYPYQWKSLKSSWDNEFKRADIMVTVNLTIRHVGNRRTGYTMPSRQA